ncbi:hypothetical protein Tco_0127840 [Tanacetum coccineum]
MSLCGCNCADIMANVNVNAPAEQAPAMAPPTQTDDQILPCSSWVLVGKSNCYLDVEKSQSNPIYKIVVHILKHTNFFRAFTASSTIPSIYIQQFWDTVRYDKNTGSYRCQLDEQWFDLTKYTLRDALQITPVDNNNSFSSPPTPDALINFVNELGYPKVVRTLYDVVTNDMFQPWRALTNIINLCLTGKTSAFERPRAPVLQILWGVVNRAYIDYTERMWEEFTQSIHSFVEDKKNLALHTQGKKKANPIVIQVLGYLKFSTKGTKHEVFGIPIPNDLITNDIREGSDPDSPTPKPATATKPEATKKSKPSAPKAALVTKPAATKASKSTSSQQSKPAPAKRSKAGEVKKKRKPKSSLQLIDEFVDEGIPVNEPRFDDEEADMQKAVEESLKDVHAAHRGPLPPVVFREPDSGRRQPLPEVQVKGKEKVIEEQVALDLLTLQTPKKKSPAEQYIFQRRSSAPTKPSGHDESSSLYAELGLTDSETESDKEVLPVIKSGVQDEGQAGSNPGDDAESQPRSSLVIHAGPNLEHMDFEATDASTQQNFEQMDKGFIATAYPKVQENLKLTIEEQVILEEPASSTGTLSSLQHLTKDFSFGDQFFNDKPFDVENEKTTAETKAKSTVSVRIHQDTSAIPPMTSPVIDLISRPDSPNEHLPLPATATATATTTTTITTLPLPPQPQQSTTDSILIKRIKNLDIPHHVSESVDEIVIDAVDWAIQATLRDRFRDLPEANMKEILHHSMWETNSYKAHEDHKKLYEALEKSMDRNHSDQLLTDLAEARRKKKKRHDSPKTPLGSPPHQPPPPPPPAGPSGTSGASGTSGSSQFPPHPLPPSTNESDQSKSTAAPSSSKTATSAEYTTWTTTNTRLKPSVSSIPKDLHMDVDLAPDEHVHSSDDEDIRNDHIPKVILKQDWWKPRPEEDRPAIPELAWSIPSSDLPVPMNNWSSALASTYAPPPENSLLAQTGNMAIFMDWFYKKQGITELTQKDLEGPAFEIVKVFHPNVIHLQYQMEECHKLLTDQVDDAIIRYNIGKPLPLGVVNK